MKNYLAIHHFASQEVKDEIVEYNATHSVEELSKLVTGPKAKCYLTLIANNELRQFCYWVAESPEAIKEQLIISKIDHFYTATEIIACQDKMIDFHTLTPSSS